MIGYGLSYNYILPRLGQLSWQQIFGANLYDVFNFNDTSSVSFDGGGQINSITSQVSARQFTQTGAARPTRVFDATLSKYVAVFDGATSWMGIPSSTGLYNFLHNATGGCVIMVFKCQVLGAARRLIGNRGTIMLEVASGTFITTSNNNQLFSIILNNAVNGTVSFTATANNTILNQFQSVVSLFNASNTTLSQRGTIILDGGAAVNNNTDNATLSDTNAGYNMTLGRRVRANDQYFNGRLVEIVIAQGIPTSTQLAQIQLKLLQDYGTLPI